MIKYIFIVPDGNGRPQLYNSDGSKCEGNAINGAIDHEIQYHHGMDVACIKVTFPVLYCKDEEEVKYHAQQQTN